MRLLPARTKSEMLADVQEQILRSKIVRHSTVSYETPDALVIRYHFTDIVRCCIKDKWIVLANGGYFTRNTKERINEQIGQFGMRIESVKESWWVTNKRGERHFFYDGITFDAEGRLLSGSRVSDLEARRELKKKIKAYAKKIATMPSLPKPSGGDCWYCLMCVQGTGETLGDAMGDTTHLREHVEDGYIHGSLLYNALEHCGYNPEMAHFIGGKGASRAVRKYLLDRLGFPT